jgi:D-threonine aldolase
MTGAEDVLLAYQPVGPKASRLLDLQLHYPATQISCLVDKIGSARSLSELFADAGAKNCVFIDLNTGMNRTGIRPAQAEDLLNSLEAFPSLYVAGVHAYDGHLTEPNVALRNEQCETAFSGVNVFLEYFDKRMGRPAIVVAGGSATFPMHLKRNVECSPGTFVFWDWGYSQHYPDEPFEFAALVLTRVISIVSDTLITTDLGYKSVASENPLPRVHFLNAPQAKPLSQSEEHLSLQVPDSSCFQIGDVLYGVPVHICPTVALYDQALVVENHQINDSWRVIARDRVITY